MVKLCTFWNDQMANFSFSEKMPEELLKLNSISKCTSEKTRKKIVMCGISLEKILDA